MPKDLNIFAETNYRNKSVKFGIRREDRRKHFYIVGKTGMGKTTLIKNMIIQDIYNGEGVALIDPHGEYAEDIIKMIPPNRYEDIVYFNPSDTEFPIGFNVMHVHNPAQCHLVASGLVAVFKKIWADSWGPRLEYVLRNAILALLEYPESTMLGIMRILVDNDYRKNVLQYVKNTSVRTFWLDEYPKYPDKLKAEATAPIQNKVGQFLSSTMMRNIVGQIKSPVDIRHIMDNKMVLIVNLSKGRIGEDNSALLGAMIITQLQMAAMSRVDIVNENERPDFYLYVDEFQNFATESFAGILSEARKYRLNLIIAHQYIQQLIDEVRNAVFGNVGTLLSFRVGADDADFLEKEFAPNFTKNDLVNLKLATCYIKLMVNGVTSDAFSANTLNTFKIPKSVETEKIITELTRKKYARPRAEVEEGIRLWAHAPGGILSTAVVHKVEEPSPYSTQTSPKQPVFEKTQEVHIQAPSQYSSFSQNTQSAQYPQTETGDLPAQKEMFETKCDGCGNETMVPFKPDGKRPVLCKDCLAVYRRQKAIMENPNAIEHRITDIIDRENSFTKGERNKPSQSPSMGNPSMGNPLLSKTPSRFGVSPVSREKEHTEQQTPLQQVTQPAPISLKEALSRQPISIHKR